VEQATKLFADIQSAYEVLSDPQERAWYDSHRDVFLGGSQPNQRTQNEFFYNIRMTTAADVIKLMMKYSGRVDYSISSGGFYGGLREFFGQLAREEEIACKWENMDHVEYPDFGLKDDDYDEVVRPFYAAWNGFATRKSYSWKDYYRPPDAPDRRIRRLMEKENKSIRDDAIREFNDAVRSLIAFVRKRDPRYQENQKSEEERQKILRDAAAAQSARSRAARQAKLDALERQTVPDWTKSTTVDDHEGGFSSDDDSEQQQIECVVCNKTFKSEAQYEAHEKSKKHLKLLKRLQREMRDQDHEIAEVDGQVATSTVVQDSDPDAGEEDAITGNGVSHLQDENNGQGHDRTETTNSEMSANEESDVDGDVDSLQENSSKEDDGDYAPRSEIEGRLLQAEAADLANKLKPTAIEDKGGTSDTEASSAPKLGKAKQKRAKRAAQKDAGPTDSTSSEFKCVVCRAEFASKTKLFTHIKEKGHAAPLKGIAGAKGGKSSKAKKK
jgi:DnaJ homolog subfamily A member 5